MSLISQDLIILTSPPASGKTYWITSFKEQLGSEVLLVISPLRALADECLQKWGPSVFVMTPEEWLLKRPQCQTVIFDEFHLFFYWGDSFRSSMWEAFYEICFEARLTVLLTATFNASIQSEVIHFRQHFDSITWLDFGNLRLKYSPSLYLLAPSKNWILKEIESQENGEGSRLIFCQYRDEVLELEQVLRAQGYTTISCVGGEAREMAGKIIKNPHPDFIIATTVLSHGVNLPTIRKIYFLYSVKNQDFWIQMVARGGRKGESYQVFALEKPFDLPFSPVRNILTVIWFSLKQFLSLRSLSP